MLVYLLDSNSIYAGTATVDPLAPLPVCATTAPPATTGSQVAQFVANTWTILPAYPTIDYSSQNEVNAIDLLNQTDWACLPNVANAELSNPFLTNQSAYFAYQSAVRAIAVTPPTTPATFPAVPTPSWGSE